jgi:hypothetical protein
MIQRKRVRNNEYCYESRRDGKNKVCNNFYEILFNKNIGNGNNE